MKGRAAGERLFCILNKGGFFLYGKCAKLDAKCRGLLGRKKAVKRRVNFWGVFWRYATDILDIGLVSVVFYYLIVLLRGTKAVQLLKGYLIIVAVWLASSFLHLRALQWLMSQAFSLGVFAILIIFQPELRRALEELGSGRLLQPPRESARRAEEHITEILVSATSYMAKRRIGALIALEGYVSLKSYSDTGTTMRARLSEALLIQIFIPNTPLHDGAVIVRGEEIVAAGCYLPLSERRDLRRGLGTRHRAAIGLTELSDALVLVVSEETGNISLAYQGLLEEGLGEERVRERVLEWLHDHRPRSLGMRGGFLRGAIARE